MKKIFYDFSSNDCRDRTYCIDVRCWKEWWTIRFWRLCRKLSTCTQCFQISVIQIDDGCTDGFKHSFHPELRCYKCHFRFEWFEINSNWKILSQIVRVLDLKFTFISVLLGTTERRIQSVNVMFVNTNTDRLRSYSRWDCIYLSHTDAFRIVLKQLNEMYSTSSYIQIAIVLANSESTSQIGTCQNLIKV